MFGTSTLMILWGALWALTLASCAFALWKGGPAERLGAGLIFTFAILWELTFFLSAEARSMAQLVGDGLTAVGLLAIALRYASLWLGGALMFQAAQFSLHSFYFVTHRPSDTLYIVVNNTNFFAILGCLTFGSLVAWRERNKAARATSLKPPAPAAA
jgi:hypothetical protein